MKTLILILGFALNAGAAETAFRECAQDSERQKLRAAELQEIRSADQADRRGAIDWARVQPRDEARAKRIGEIFGEGCFSMAADYAAAALVFQHGSRPDHFYQAYLWSKRAIELGDESQKQMMVNAIDRYLLNIGHKQLFGAQWFTPSGGCSCLEPVETLFPEKLRKKIVGLTLKDRLDRLAEINKANPACGKVTFCDHKLTSPPKGLFPGIW